MLSLGLMCSALAHCAQPWPNVVLSAVGSCTGQNLLNNSTKELSLLDLPLLYQFHKINYFLSYTPELSNLGGSLKKKFRERGNKHWNSEKPIIHFIVKVPPCAFHLSGKFDCNQAFSHHHHDATQTHNYTEKT